MIFPNGNHSTVNDYNNNDYKNKNNNNDYKNDRKDYKQIQINTL